MHKHKIFLALLLSVLSANLMAQNMDQLVADTRKKLALIKDYRADGSMKTSVSFLKIPEEKVQFFYRAPNQLKIKTTSGVSFVPKGAVNLNINALLADKNYTVIDAGTDKINGKIVRIAKLLPNDDAADIVLSTIYIEPTTKNILRSRTTTKSNGTYELEMVYGKYAGWGLPDKIIFVFDTKDYKLPKGITFDFDDGAAAKKPVKKAESTKGTAELIFASYIINKGIDDKLFK